MRQPIKDHDVSLSPTGEAFALPNEKDYADEFQRLQAEGVVFKQELTDVGTAVVAIFEDTCGNLIQFYQEQ